MKMNNGDKIPCDSNVSKKLIEYYLTMVQEYISTGEFKRNGGMSYTRNMFENETGIEIIDDAHSSANFSTGNNGIRHTGDEDLYIVKDVNKLFRWIMRK